VRALRATGIVLSAAAVLALAACGGHGGSAGGATKLLSPAQAKQAVADATAKTTGSTLHLDLSVTIRAAGTSGSGTYSATGDLGRSLGRIDVDERFVGGDLRHEVVSRQNGHLILYETPANVPLPKGKTWLKIDLTKYGMKRYGANTSFLAGADQDPYAALTLAASPAAKVTDLGLDWLPDRTLDSHFRARVDVVSVAKARGVKGADLATLGADVGQPTQTIDVWVGKQGRVARVRVQKVLRDANTGSQLRQSSIADFSRYGEPVHVSLPPPARVADLLALSSK
jgi:hypothetical protein